jgi:signal transduction histidine kinase
LALAREVVRLHGGDIEVDSEIDEGSRFTLSLPAPAQAA